MKRWIWILAVVMLAGTGLWAVYENHQWEERAEGSFEAALEHESEEHEREERAERERRNPEAKGKPEFYEAWKWMHDQRAYPAGEIPVGAWERALEQIERFNAGKVRAFNAGDWVPLGPTPILGGQIGRTLTTARNVSGRIQAVTVDPSDPTHWLLAGAQGGIWESRDSGQTWAVRTDNLPSLWMGSIAFAPSSPRTVYAGSGELDTQYAGGGVYRSTDGGTTWSVIAGSERTFRGLAFESLLVNPSDPNDLTASAGLAASAGYRRSAFIPSAQRGAPGVYKSSDGGRTWVSRLAVNPWSLYADPTTPSRMYVGAGFLFGNVNNFQSGGLYRSTDNGNAWARVGGPWDNLNTRGQGANIGRVEIAIAPSNPNVLYVSLMDASNGVNRDGSACTTTCTDGGLLGLWRTSNAWATTPTWTAIDLRPTDDGSGLWGYCGWNVAFNLQASQCFYDNVLSVDPSNPDRLFAGGIELWRYDALPTPTWTEVSQTSVPAAGIHVDQHSFTWVGNRLVVGNDGGLWSTTNGGGTWSVLNQTLSLTQYYRGAAHPTRAQALGGAQDNGSSRWDGSSWRLVGFGDGAAAAYSPSSPDTNWAISSQFLSVLRTLNGGTSFQFAVGGIPDADLDRAPFIAEFKVCPANQNVVIAGTDRVWRSNNFFGTAAPTWAANSPNLGVDTSGGGSVLIQVSALAFAPSDPTCNTYAYGSTRLGRVFLTTDGGVTWRNLSSGLPGRWVSSLAFNPTNPDVLYSSISGFDEATPAAPGRLFHSANARAAAPTWANLSPPVNIPFNTVVVRPDQPETVFVGSDIGIWRSADAGQTWLYYGPADGLPNVQVTDLQFGANNSRLIAFTYGRGAFALDLGRSSPDFSLTVQRSGTGRGSVTSSTPGIDCGNTCAARFGNSPLTLTATPASGSDFGGWSGDCAGLEPCTLTMSADRRVAAAFVPPTLLVAPSANPPAPQPQPPRAVERGSTNAVLLDFTLGPKAAPSTLTALTLQSSGSGNESLDITAVRLYASPSGQVAAGQTPLATGRYSADNGNLTLTLTTPLAVGASTRLLVTYDLNTVIAARSFTSATALPAGLVGLGLLSLLGWLLRQRRWLPALTLLLLGLLTLSACGSPPVIRSYSLSLTGLTTQEGSSVTPLPLEGATINVTK